MPGDQLSPTEREARRRRLERIFGDVLPDQTRDDADESAGDSEDATEDWLKRQVPPHHG